MKISFGVRPEKISEDMLRKVWSLVRFSSVGLFLYRKYALTRFENSAHQTVRLSAMYFAFDLRPKNRRLPFTAAGRTAVEILDAVVFHLCVTVTAASTHAV